MARPDTSKRGPWITLLRCKLGRLVGKKAGSLGIISFYAADLQDKMIRQYRGLLFGAARPFGVVLPPDFKGEC